MATEPIHQLPSGRWELRYRDPNGRPRRQRFDTKGAAKDHLAEVRTKGRTGTWVAPELGRMTFGKWVDEWWGTNVHLRSATRTRYNRDLKLHIRPRFERAPLAKITPRDVRAWLSEMQASGIPASSIRRRFSVFRKVMGDAVAMDMIARTPCRGVTPPADTRLDITVLSAAEVGQLAAAMPAWCQSWVWVAAYTGLRWSEMIGLQRRDIDLLRKTLTVHRQIIEVGSKFEGFGEPKTAAGRRSIDLPAFLCKMLETQLAERAQPGVEGLVFVNTRGNPPHLSSFTSQTWKKAREKIGRPDLRWHDLRHTAVALAIANGAHPKSIQERMGHSSITVTLDRYGHLFPSLGVAVADALEATYQLAVTGTEASGATVTDIDSATRK